MIYLDSSAVVKTIRREPESGPLLTFLRRHAAAPRFGSSLVATEVLRAVARHTDREALPATDAAQYRAAAIDRVNALHLVDVSRELLDAAAELTPVGLRTLDAVHLATALRFRESLTSFVTYDQRLAEAAAAAGLPVDAPAPGV